MMNHEARGRQKGSALLNVALALALGLSVIAGAWAVGSGAIREARMKESEQTLKELSGAIIQAYRNKSNFAGLSMNRVYDQGLLDQSYFRSRGVLHLPVKSGQVYVYPRDFTTQCASSSTDCSNSFSIDIPGLDYEECIEVALFSFGQRHVGTTFWTTSFWQPHNTPVTANTVINACRKTEPTTVGFRFI